MKRLVLSHFRNYQQLEFVFNSPIVILVGNNAQGKSNLLESIFLLATTKSPKAQRDEELIEKGASTCRLEGVIESGGDETTLEIIMHLQEGLFQKRVRVNGIPRRVIDYIGNLSVVLFLPEDINLVTGSPSLRRWHVDLTLAQIDREYKRALTNYGEVVKRRNRVLKSIQEGLSGRDELTFWSTQLLLEGEIVSQRRADFFAYLNSTERKFGECQFVLHQNILTPEKLQLYQDREIASATTLIGPHRDDFLFLQQGTDLAKFGSRGEQRTAVLDLKVSEASFVEHISGQRPILLLDDVFSELDERHREHVLALTKLQQTIIATVELDPYLESAFGESAQIVFVRNGEFVN